MAVEKSRSVSSHIASVVNLPGYKIKDLLGRGGMAVVYLAVQESIGREVALKVLTPDHSDESFTDRFLREAQIVSRLAHPNIVTVFDAGVHQGCHYMSMEYIPGLNLRQARDTLTRKEKIKLIQQVALALDYAGKKGFVHRDIKPENILQHEDGRAILTDFGIARGMEIQKSLTITGKAIGTPYYMSPEQTKGLKVDPRSDIYSLGIVLFQVLAGYLPYDGASLVAIGIKHISDPVPELPAGLAIFQPIINKAMSKDPDNRYQTAGELAQALDAIPEAVIDEIDRKAAALRQAEGGTPVNKTQVADASNPSGPQIAPATKDKPAASKPAATARKAAESFAADPSMAPPSMAPIDITNTADFKRLRNRRWFLFMILLVCAIAVGYINQKELSQFWQSQLEPSLRPFIAKVTPSATTKPVEPSSVQTDTTLSTPAPFQESDTQGSTPNQDTITNTQQEVSDPTQTENQISELLASLEEQPENAKPLLQLYRDALELNPDDTMALQGIKNSQQWFFEKIEMAYQDNDIEQAKQLSALLLEMHPSIASTDEYQQLNKKQQQLDTVQTHLKKVQVYINTNTLLEPDKANAFEELQIALELAPENPEALALKEELTNIFIQRAKQNQAEGKLTAALKLVNSGLTVDTENTTLTDMQNDLTTRLENIKQVRELLAKAKKQFAADKLLSPEGNSAYNFYHAVREIQKNNAEAKNGLLNIEHKLSERVQLASTNKDFDAARSILDNADKYFKNSSVLAKARTDLEAAIDATLPRITKVLFSDTPISNLTGKQKTTIEPGRTLHVGFEYKNFSAETTLILANLLDGSGQVQIAQKPVILNSNHGQHIFYIELPVEGFADGTYNLELLLEKKALSKKSFQVQRKLTE
ncbi:MAG: serine/threonine protein kinase [Gammaproteobacteria bacterium]|nr:serine/threonine protein kinase [Gammaproteobacteria bacterium]